MNHPIAFKSIDVTYNFRKPTVEREVLGATNRVITNTCNVLNDVLSLLDKKSSYKPCELLQKKVSEMTQSTPHRQTNEIGKLLIANVEAGIHGTNKAVKTDHLVILQDKIMHAYRATKQANELLHVSALVNELLHASALDSAQELIENLIGIPDAINKLLEKDE